MNEIKVRKRNRFMMSPPLGRNHESIMPSPFLWRERQRAALDGKPPPENWLTTKATKEHKGISRSSKISAVIRLAFHPRLFQANQCHCATSARGAPLWFFVS